MNFEKIKTLKLVIFALLCCPTVTVQSKQLLHIGTPKQGGHDWRLLGKDLGLQGQ